MVYHSRNAQCEESARQSGWCEGACESGGEFSATSLSCRGISIRPLAVLILLAKVKIQFIDSCLLQDPKTVFLNNHARINIGVNRLFPNPAAQQPTGPHSDRNYASPYQSKSIDLHTPHSALAPSSSASPSKRPATPPPALNFDGVPNLLYFRDQWVYVGNLERLDPKLSQEAFNRARVKQLAYNTRDDLYDNKELGPLGIILLGQLGQFTTLKSVINNFNPDKPEFSLLLQVEEGSLKILKVLIRRRDRHLTITNPLRVKVAESDITSLSFTPRDLFPLRTTEQLQTTTKTPTIQMPLDSLRVIWSLFKLGIVATSLKTSLGRLYPASRSAC